MNTHTNCSDLNSLFCSIGWFLSQTPSHLCNELFRFRKPLEDSFQEDCDSPTLHTL